MSDSYYNREKHKYLSPKTGLFGNYVYSQIHDDSFSQYDTVIELGAGMGRFSVPLVKIFANVTLVEPVDDYVSILQEKFVGSGIRIINTTAENFLASYEANKPILVFCFHLMHHIKREHRDVIYQFVKQTGSKCILVEPNPYNPLIFLQILFHRNMSVAKEIKYILLTRRKYRKELEENGLTLASFKRFCFFPPFITNLLLKKLPWRIFDFAERCARFFPFLPSYQLIVCQAKNSYVKNQGQKEEQ